MPGVFAVACFCNQNMERSTSGPRREGRLDGSFQPDSYFPIVVSVLRIASLLHFAPQCLVIHIENGWNLFLVARLADLAKQHFLAENPQWVIVNKSRAILG
jgi:hypothetical protein